MCRSSPPGFFCDGSGPGLSLGLGSKNGRVAGQSIMAGNGFLSRGGVGSVPAGWRGRVRVGTPVGWPPRHAWASPTSRPCTWSSSALAQVRKSGARAPAAANGASRRNLGGKCANTDQGRRAGVSLKRGRDPNSTCVLLCDLVQFCMIARSFRGKQIPVCYKYVISRTYSMTSDA